MSIIVSDEQREELFEFAPRLRHKPFEPTSRRTPPERPIYNCAAYALGIYKGEWWPLPAYKWFDGLPRDDSLASFVTAFEQRGYARCSDSSLEHGYQKVAILTNADGPQHLAVQQANGRWRSKFGLLEDLECELEDLTGDKYGTPTVFLKRRIPGSGAASER